MHYQESGTLSGSSNSINVQCTYNAHVECICTQLVQFQQGSRSNVSLVPEAWKVPDNGLLTIVEEGHDPPLLPVVEEVHDPPLLPVVEQVPDPA